MRMKNRTFSFTEDQHRLFEAKGKNAPQWVRIAIDEKAEREKDAKEETRNEH